MRTYHLNDFLEFPYLAFGLAMTQPLNWSGAPRSRPSLAKRVISVVGACNLIYQNIGLVLHLLRLAMRQEKMYDDTLEVVLQVVETGGVLGLVVVASCEMFLFFGYSDRISQLIEDFERLFPSEQLQRAQFRAGKNAERRQAGALGYYSVHHYARQFRASMKTSTIFFMAAYLWYQVFPLLEAFNELSSPLGGGFSYRYQSNTWYPWQTERNAESIPLYVLAYLCQAHSALTGVAYIMGGEFMFSFFITQMQLHFDFLADALENLDAGDDRAPEKLKYIIDYHSKLLRFSSEINDIFSISFLINLITSSIAICLIGCAIVIFKTFKYSLGLLAFLFFTLMICYNGSEFTSASEKLMPAAFYNNWYEGNASYRKMIHIFIVRSVQPNVLRAHKFADVSMQTYMAMLKFSYQLFALFQTMV